MKDFSKILSGLVNDFFQISNGIEQIAAIANRSALAQNGSSATKVHLVAMKPKPQIEVAKSNNEILMNIYFHSRGK